MDNKSIGIKISKYLEKKCIPLEQLAYMLKMNPRPLKNKLEGNGKIYISDAIKIKEELKMSLEEFEEIFFNIK